MNLLPSKCYLLSRPFIVYIMRTLYKIQVPREYIIWKFIEGIDVVICLRIQI